MFLTDKYFIFRQSFVNTYYALVYLTVGIEPAMEDDEEDDGKSTQSETGNETDRGAGGGETSSTDDDTRHVNGGTDTRDQGTDQPDNTQGKEHEKEEL